MTINQTIDGVPRGLLEVFAGPRNSTPEQMRKAMDELRALLDKQVNFLTPDCPDCACVQDGQCLCIPSKPAAQPQGDSPTNAALIRDLTGVIEQQAALIASLRAEQPAPVAAVLLDQLANGSHLDDVPNHDDDSLSEIAHRCTCGQRSSLLKHAGRVDAEVALHAPMMSGGRGILHEMKTFIVTWIDAGNCEIAEVKIVACTHRGAFAPAYNGLTRKQFAAVQKEAVSVVIKEL